MGRISDDDIARVRDATDLVALISERVVLKQKGRLFWGNCPFHGEKTPSFKIDPGSQLWHCFGCGAGGDAYGYVMRTDNVDFPEAVRLLADRARIELVEEEGGVPRGQKDRLFSVLAETADFYHRVLTGSREPSSATARDYLSQRGFGSEVAKRWQLGFAPGRGALVRHLRGEGFTAEEMIGANVALMGDGGTLKDRFYERVMFPVRDLQGRVVAFGGRIIGPGEPKYLNTSETPVFHKSANLYAIDQAKGPITASGEAVVVEGYTDVIAMHEAGLNNVVATLGTALTQQHVKLLGRFANRVVYLFDGDEAGLRAADRATEFIDRTATPEAGASRVDLRVAVLPYGLDPADHISANGASATRSAIEEAQPLLRFAIDRRLARWDLEQPEQRARALSEAAAILAPIKDSLLADDYANHIADRLFADFATVKRAVNASRTRPAHEDAEPGDGADQAAEGLQEPISGDVRAERDLIALLVEVPSLRARARELLDDSLLSDPSYRAMAEVIRDSDAGMSAAALAGALDARVPGASRVLSAAMQGEERQDELESLASDLVRRLKEFTLERRIAVGRARMKDAESIKDFAVRDEIYEEVSSLMQELASLRGGGAVR